MKRQPSFSLFTLSTDGWLLFGTRIIRLFAYGFLSVVLVFFLAAAGLTETQIGVLLTLTLIGDTVISLWITTTADRIGRRRMLITGAVLMVFGGTLFTVASNFALLVVAATIGVISPSGNEVGPFLSIEQAALAQIIPPARRTSIFAWYNLVGSFATALGALSVGALSQGLHITGVSALGGYRTIVMSYAAMGSLIAFLFTRLSPAVEATQTDQGSESRLLRKSGAGNPAGSSSSAERALSGIEGRLGLRGSGRVVLKLSALFSLDAFAGGFVLQSIVAYWFYVRFGVQPAVLGGIFFGGNILAGLSALAAARLASRIGLINTMVFTHFPSNILLILVPLMPNLHWAIVVLLARFSISQMDVPTRQSFTMAVVDPDERSAAAGVTSIARSVGSSLAPALAGRLMGASLLNVPFFLAGGLKIVYDLLLYQSFRAIKTSEETTARSARCSMIDSSPKVESPK